MSHLETSSGPRTRVQRLGPTSIGFALPVAILALVAIGLVITGGIQFVLRQQPKGPSTHRATQAFYVAESGMNTVLANWSTGRNSLRVWGPPEVRVGTTGQGEWEAEIRRVGERLFFVRSTGRVGQGAGGGPAKRAVGIAARAEAAHFEVPAALQTLGPVQLSGSARIVGEDQVPEQWGPRVCSAPRQDLPAVVTPEGVAVEGLEKTLSAAGAPAPHIRDPLLSMTEFDRFGGMSWEDLTSLASVSLSGGIIEGMGPTLTENQCDYTDPLNWGDPESPTAPCGDYFPIVHLRGDATIRSNGWGQGILLADGNLDLGGGFHFFGLVIAQGSIDFKGGSGDGPSVFGAVSTKNPEQARQQFTGEAVLQNSRCAVRRAIASNESLTRVRPLVERGWVDLIGASF